MTKDEKIIKLTNALKFYADFNTYYNKVFFPEMYGEGIVHEGILKDLQFNNYWGVSLPGKLAQETIDCVYPFEAKHRKMTEAKRKNDINYMQLKNKTIKRDSIKDIQSYLDMINKLNDPEEDKRKEILFRRF